MFDMPKLFITLQVSMLFLSFTPTVLGASYPNYGSIGGKQDQSGDLYKEISCLEQTLRYLKIKDDCQMPTEAQELFVQNLLDIIASNQFQNFNTMAPSAKIAFMEKMQDRALDMGYDFVNSCDKKEKLESAIKLYRHHLSSLEESINDELLPVLSKSFDTWELNKETLATIEAHCNHLLSQMPPQKKDYHKELSNFIESKKSNLMMKVVLIECLKRTNTSFKNLCKEDQYSYSIIDLKEWWRETCGQNPSGLLRKAIMSLSGSYVDMVGNIICGYLGLLVLSASPLFVIAFTELFLSLILYDAFNKPFSERIVSDKTYIITGCVGCALAILIMTFNGTYYWANKKR